MAQCAAPAHSGTMPLYTITVYHQTARISTENRVFSDKNSALPCRCRVDFPQKCAKNAFFATRLFFVFRPFYGKYRGFSARFPPFTAKLCTFLYIRPTMKNHNLPIISPFLFFKIKFCRLQSGTFSLFSPVFHPTPPLSLLFHQILPLISGFLRSRQLAHNLIKYEGTLWTRLDVFQGAA